MVLQAIPLFLLAITVIILLNDFFKNQKLLRRLLFLSIFTLMFYSNGTNAIEVFLQYPLWRVVGQEDWLPFRQAIGFLPFMLVYLIPGFLNLLLIIPSIWLRPKKISIVVPLLILVLMLWGTYHTATYFVPQIQQQLDKGYSLKLIDDLINNDFILRNSKMFIQLLLLIWVFVKMENKNTFTTN
jgi:hypothetical protein